MSFIQQNAIAQEPPVTAPAVGAAGCGSYLANFNVRESYQFLGDGQYTDSRNFIHACILEGFDPPHGGRYTWIPRGGRGHGALSGSNIQFPTGRADARCPPSVLPEDLVCNSPDWPNCNGSPGGLSQPGGPGTQSCVRTSNATGEATEFDTSDPEIPEIEEPEIDFSCGLELSAAFSGGLGQGQACASGGLSFCGIISIEGSGCVGADGVTLGAAYVGPGGRYEGEVGYNEIQGVPLDSALQLANYLQRNPNSNFILPEGGNISFGGEISVEVSRADGTTETVQLSSLSLPADAFIAGRLTAGSGNNGTLIVTPDATYTIPFNGTTNTPDPRGFSITSDNGDFVFTETNATQLPNHIPEYAQQWIENINNATSPPVIAEDTPQE